jgi:hypothetical protein
MWSICKDVLLKDKAWKFLVERNARPASVSDVLDGWWNDESFRELFNAKLADVPFAEFRWETPAVARETLTRPFECVVIDSPGLVKTPDVDAFAEHFATSDGQVAVFPNLGGDAILIAPCPLGDPSVYSHLGTFVRNAPDRQRNALWMAIGDAMQRSVGKKPVWLSTAGAGVSWLHVRLDDRPKYYSYAPYR